jgi:selenocysteine-specific elongation factor
MTISRKNIMLGTAGHVDHGKTALVKLLTGCETDTLAEEKQRGLTIDLGFAPCRLADDRIVGIVDVPGHVDFIRNMVAGAHGLDVVMFVVAADDGIMPQTHEHLHILTLMGVQHGLVALTKIDLVEPARRGEVVQQLRSLLAGTFLAQAPICPISNITGEGFEGFFDALNQAVADCGERPCGGPFRVWVEDSFTIRGAGTVITGIPTSGTARIGEALTLLPGSVDGHLRRLQVYGEDATEARAGECAALNIPEIDHLAVRRGMLLCAADSLSPVTMVEAELRILDFVKGKIDDFLQVHLHVGTASVLANVAMLENSHMTAGQQQMVQLRLTDPLPIVPGERFVLRANVSSDEQSGLITIGGGRILGTSNVRLRRKKTWTLASLAARREAIDQPERWCELNLREAGQPLTAPRLAIQCFLRPDELAPLIQSLSAQGRVVQLPGGEFAHSELIQQTAAKMLTTLASFHGANPHRAGMGPGELFASALNPAVGQLAIESLLRTKKIVPHGEVFAQAGWTPRLADPDQQLCDAIADAFKAAGWAGPTASDLAASLRQPLSRIEKLIQLFVDRGVLIRLDPKICIHREALQSAKDIALRLFARKPSFSTMEFRDALGVSRKFAVPLLDYFDRIRFTVRTGHDRTAGVEAKKLLSAPPSPKPPA